MLPMAFRPPGWTAAFSYGDSSKLIKRSRLVQTSILGFFGPPKKSTSKALVAAEKGRFSSSACVEATSLDFVARVSAYFLEFNPA